MNRPKGSVPQDGSVLRLIGWLSHGHQSPTGRAWSMPTPSFCLPPQIQAMGGPDSRTIIRGNARGHSDAPTRLAGLVDAFEAANGQITRKPEGNPSAQRIVHATGAGPHVRRDGVWLSLGYAASGPGDSGGRLRASKVRDQVEPKFSFLSQLPAGPDPGFVPPPRPRP